MRMRKTNSICRSSGGCREGVPHPNKKARFLTKPCARQQVGFEYMNGLYFLGSIFSSPFIYGLNTSGINSEPSFCW